MLNKTDCELVQAYIEGKEIALKILLDRHKRRVYNYIYNKVNNPELAEDLFQDVFVKVILTIKGGKYKDEGKFLHWIFRISHNLIIDHFRINNKNLLISESQYINKDYNVLDTIRDTDKSIEDTIINEQINKDLNILINLLPNDQKEIIKLRFYENLTYKEIAEKTEVGINTALGRMRYAITNLRKLIENKNIGIS